jgi:putative heme-binding domain-containing protein
MMNFKSLPTIFRLFIGLSIFMFSCQSSEDQPITEQITVGNITLPAGFEIEEVYNPGENEQGSWVSITKDDQGRLYASSQYGNIYRVTLPESKEGVVAVKKLDFNIGMAQGLLWHKGDLYALVNSNNNNDLMMRSGFYKVTDSDADGELDDVKLLRSFVGNGEHGPHNIELSPDGKSLYLVLGNHTDIPEDLDSTIPKVWGEDNLLPVIKDPSGHANSRTAPGGWVVRTDFEGENWTIMSVGMRNTYDFAFNADGELFGFDSDMEYDMGMPWYRPIRLIHLTSGAEFGWRTGTGKFLAEYPDNLPGVADLGQGSPTGVMSGDGLKFPSYYQNGLYLFDWSYGTMYYASLKPEGSSYTAEVTEFLSGVPLPLTNGIVGNDGAMYFLMGGRRLESALYRVSYTGERNAELQELTENRKGRTDRELRKELEALHTKKVPDRMDFILKHLDHKDRFIRYAARVAMENQDYQLWEDEIDKNSSVLKTVNLSLSIARHGDDQDRIGALNALMEIDWINLPDSEKMDHIRAVGLLNARLEGELSSQLRNEIVLMYQPAYLKSSQLINQELAKILSYFQVSDIITPTLVKMETDTATTDLKAIYLSGEVSGRSDQYGKDVENMLANMPNKQSISYAKSLSVIKVGWTSQQRERYFLWYKNALDKSGGLMYSQFIRRIQGIALANLPESERQFYEALGEESDNGYLTDMVQPKGPGKNWTAESAVEVYNKNLSTVNFENGQNMFKSALCISCHSISGKGGTSGPELTQVRTRFSLDNLVAAIINPTAVVSDRYRNTVYTLKNGRTMVGRLIDETENHMVISTNAFTPSVTTRFRKNQLASQEESMLSPMPPALINRLNDQEVADLIAYLMTGGNEASEIYK